MKTVIMRISILFTIIVFGVIAITYAQRHLDPSKQDSSEAVSASNLLAAGVSHARSESSSSWANPLATSSNDHTELATPAEQLDYIPLSGDQYRQQPATEGGSSRSSSQSFRDQRDAHYQPDDFCDASSRLPAHEMPEQLPGFENYASQQLDPQSREQYQNDMPTVDPNVRFASDQSEASLSSTESMPPVDPLTPADDSSIPSGDTTYSTAMGQGATATNPGTEQQYADSPGYLGAPAGNQQFPANPPSVGFSSPMQGGTPSQGSNPGMMAAQPGSQESSYPADATSDYAMRSPEAYAAGSTGSYPMNPSQPNPSSYGGMQGEAPNGSDPRANTPYYGGQQYGTQPDAAAPGAMPPPSYAGASPLASPAGALPADVSAAYGNAYRPAGNGAASEIGTGLPGDRRFEGAQAPHLEINKVAPPEVKVGQPARFAIIVRNTGECPAHEVEIHDVIPRGTRLLSTEPPASRDQMGRLVWAVESLPPNEETTVEIELMPLEEGEIGSQATVRFAAHASVRATATRPMLEIVTSAPPQVNLGQQVPIKIRVTNTGSGTTTGIVLEEIIPDGLEFPGSPGPELEYQFGDLKPGQTRELSLALRCVKPGVITNTLNARANGDLSASHSQQFEIIAPDLEIAIEGSKRRFLESQAVYHFAVANPGTAPAKMVELSAHLPPGLKFDAANNQGYYDQNTHSVHWRIKELGVGEKGIVELRAMPVNVGEQKLLVETSDASGLSAQSEHPVLIDGISAVSFQVTDSADPVDVSGETTYEIVVNNQGTKESTNVQLTAQLPPQLQVVSIQAPVRYAPIDTTGLIRFEPLPRLGPKAETTYRVQVRGVQPGDVRFQVQVQASDMQLPVTKEESTRIFSDELADES